MFLLKMKSIRQITVLIVVSFSVLFTNSNVFAGAQGGGGGGECKADFIAVFSEVYDNIYDENLKITWRLKYNLQDVIEEVANLLNDNINGIRINTVDSQNKMPICPNESDNQHTACSEVSKNIITLNCDPSDESSWQNISEKLKRKLVLHEPFYWFNGSSESRPRINDANMFRSNRLVEQMPVVWPLDYVDPTANVQAVPNGIYINWPKVKVGNEFTYINARNRGSSYGESNNPETNVAGLCTLYGYSESDLIDIDTTSGDLAQLDKSGKVTKVSSFHTRSGEPAVSKLGCYNFVGRK